MRARKREGTRILELFVKGVAQAVVNTVPPAVEWYGPGCCEHSAARLRNGVAQAVVNIVPPGCGMVWPRVL
jgi:hypothetical protein